jgi:hypothetical protein
MERSNPMLTSPNLDSLSGERPRRKLTLIRMLWPKIEACLARGHTVRDVQQKLALDGIRVNYKNLCAVIAELRNRNQRAEERSTAAPASEKEAMPVAPTERYGRRLADTLENVRRLTEKRRPGFNYTGTLPDKDLFGE